MAGSRPRSLGERLSTSALLILLGALAGVVSLVVFVTGKNLICGQEGDARIYCKFTCSVADTSHDTA